MVRRIRIVVMMEAPACDFVDERNIYFLFSNVDEIMGKRGPATWMNGYPVGVSRAVSTSPIQKQKVTSMIHPSTPLRTTVHIMERGRVREASLSSSASG
jgi:hypothetical protein